MEKIEGKKLKSYAKKKHVFLYEVCLEMGYKSYSSFHGKLNFPTSEEFNEAFRNAVDLIAERKANDEEC